MNGSTAARTRARTASIRLLLVVDGAGGVGGGDAFVAGREGIPFSGPRICALNKIDLLGRPQIARAADASRRAG